MLVRLRDSYTLADKDVSFNVTVGEGQKCYIEVQLNGRLIAQGPAIVDLKIGKGAELAGSRLRATAVVTDTNKLTNRTSVTYVLSGGKATRTWVSSHTVETEGDTVDYDAIFVLL